MYDRVHKVGVRRRITVNILKIRERICVFLITRRRVDPRFLGAVCIIRRPIEIVQIDLRYMRMTVIIRGMMRIGVIIAVVAAAQVKLSGIILILQCSE